MGNLKPGATYVYESPDGGHTTYAREVGTSERIMVGQTSTASKLIDDMKEAALWGEIRRTALHHPGLQAELERVIMFYYLIKEENNSVMWHPV
jgi:hypothetical protein